MLCPPVLYVAAKRGVFLTYPPLILLLNSTNVTPKMAGNRKIWRNYGSNQRHFADRATCSGASKVSHNARQFRATLPATRHIRQI
ncbi:hypothetical protein RA28_04800 [Ruegeria sp. ANG-S4]|nr:hypothetical protein RA28_04800 [Ruegeria sp. ANG-S4]